MTLGFLFLGRGAFKVLGAVIQAALDRGHRVVVLYERDSVKPGESIEESHFGVWPKVLAVPYRRGEPLLGPLRAHGVEAFVGPSLHYLLAATGLAPEIPAIRAAGVRLYSVDYAFETLTTSPEGYRVLDVTFYASAYERELHWRITAEGFAAVGRDVDLHARSAVSGLTMTDQLAIVDREAARRRFGIAPGQRVVVLMTLKMNVPRDSWRRLVWGGGSRLRRTAIAIGDGRLRLVPQIWRRHGYREFVDALDGLCRRENAVLIVKSREKNNDPSFLRAPVHDDEVFPYTSIQLMAIADLCVHFQSGAVMEAAFAGVPSLSVQIPHEHLQHHGSFEEAFGGEPGTLQNFPGIVWRVGGSDAAARLRSASLADFRVDPAARRRYVEKFLGFDDTRASIRVLETIERLG